MRKFYKIVLFNGIMIVVLFNINIFAGYIESIDTTDIHGFPHDSSFLVDFQWNIMGLKGPYFTYSPNGWFFNAFFNDINLAPDLNDSNVMKLSGRGHPISPKEFVSCVIRKADSTFEKINIINKLSDGRYVFQFGHNTFPNNRILANSNYDRRVLYRPNNLRITPVDTSFAVFNFQVGTIFNWEPPLDNDNHLLGYILCVTRTSIIDTTRPIYPSQCCSTHLLTNTNVFLPTNSPVPPDTSCFYNPNWGPQYFNVAAVYQEGVSDLSWPWGYFVPPVSTIEIKNNKTQAINRILVKDNKVFCIWSDNIAGNNASAKLTIYDLKGEQKAIFTMKSNNLVTLGRLSAGIYLIRAELSDRTVLTRPFMYTK
ncbi:MAG TPA: T9SS type A sorting domain-containing protein [Chitinivibrionales bacterium]|nr:T9SS type A sorting domain-containing protein [Chitinivibrionales bacterium]